MGLDNLQFIGGSLYFDDNNTFEDFTGLERLKSIGLDLYLDRNENLKTLKGLDSLKTIGRSLDITDNDALESLNGLGQLEKIASRIRIKNNQVLNSINSFNLLDSLSHSLTIESNNSLGRIEGFKNLVFVGDRFEIHFNSNLKTITAFENLEIMGSLSIGANSQLENLDNFKALTTIDGNFSLSNNASLNNIKGLINLERVNGAFLLKSHNQLVNLSGLENLTYIEGFISIDGNRMLQSLSALQNLQHISEGMSISYQPRLKNLDGLDNIPATKGPIYINHNDSLVDLSAIANLDPSAISELIIRENPRLTACNITSICKLLELATNELIIFQNNAADCMNRSEVSVKCNINFTPTSPSTKTINWNWVSHIKRTEELAHTFPTNLFQDSQNNNYLVGFYSSNTFFNDQLLEFSDRVGVDRNSFIAKYDPQGNLIWVKKENIGKRLITATIDALDIIHIFAKDTTSFSHSYRYEQYDTDWQQLSSVSLIDYKISSGAFTRPQISVDKAYNRYFLFRGDGIGNINILGIADTLKLPPAHTYWVLKYTAEGELAWLDTIHSGGFVNIEMDINEQEELTLAGTYNKNLYVQQEILPGRSGSSLHIFCLQYTQEGKIKWARTFGEGIGRDYCNDLVVQDNSIYLTGTLGFGGYNLGIDSIDVFLDDPFLFKLDHTGAVEDYLILPLNASPSKGVSIALNEANDLIWTGKYSGRNALINETFLPHEASYFLQQHLFILTIDQSDGLQVESINTIESLGTYEIPEIIPMGDSAFLAAGFFSQDIVLGDTSFQSDFIISNLYDSFIGTFGIIDTGFTVSYTQKPLLDFVNIFPNPTSAYLNIHFPKPMKVSIRLSNMAGQLIHHNEFTGLTHQLRLPKVPKGIYFLHLQSEEGYFLRKIVIH